jgi:formiminoglutamase
VSLSSPPSDPLWPRASDWFVPAGSGAGGEYDIGLIGVPAFRSSISATSANTTPLAVRDALGRYSTFAASTGTDLAALRAVDFGDVTEPDGREGEARVAETVSAAAAGGRLLVALGGDNSITASVMSGLAGDRLAEWGLITLDAHHDLRDGESNGSPVRRLIEAGLPGERVVQIGIADFANSAEYSARARELGITVVTRDDLRTADPELVAARALEIAGAGGGGVYVDIDVDVCDRSVAPGCPASVPGGMSADELRRFAFLLARGSAVRAIDITEVDAIADTTDRRTVRLAALIVLEAAAGLVARTAASTR